MRPGEEAADFTLPSFINGGKTEMFKLSSLRGKFVLILFYPVDFGYVTPTEFYELETLMLEFKKNNCEVIAVSTEHIARYVYTLDIGIDSCFATFFQQNIPVRNHNYMQLLSLVSILQFSILLEWFLSSQRQQYGLCLK